MRLISTLRDCKQRSSTVNKKASTVNKLIGSILVVCGCKQPNMDGKPIATGIATTRTSLAIPYTN